MTDDIINWDEDPEDTNGGELQTLGAGHNPDDEVATLIQYDGDGNRNVTEVNFSSPELNENEAREITERIKNTTNVLYLLVKRAHAGKAYKALGYTSFESYIKEEFNFSKVYAYRLLNQANFIEAIEAKIPEGTEVHVSEPVSTKLKKVLPELLVEIEQRVEQLDDEDDAGAVIEDIIRERREQQEANNFLNDEDDEELEPAFQPSGNGGQWQGDEDNDEVGFDDEFDDDGDEAELEDSNDVRRKFDKIYNLYSGLRHVSTVGDGDELIPFLPKERWDEFQELLSTTIPWLTEFQAKFSTYLEEQKTETAVTDFEADDSEVDDEDDY